MSACLNYSSCNDIVIQVIQFFLCSLHQVDEPVGQYGGRGLSVQCDESAFTRMKVSSVIFVLSVIGKHAYMHRKISHLFSMNFLIHTST